MVAVIFTFFFTSILSQIMTTFCLPRVKYINGITIFIGESNYDEILDAVADDITEDEHITALGRKLGILQGDIDRCIKSNMSGPHVTSRGTCSMLRNWSKTMSEREGRVTLSAALERAGLGRIVDDHLREGIHWNERELYLLIHFLGRTVETMLRVCREMLPIYFAHS